MTDLQKKAEVLENHADNQIGHAMGDRGLEYAHVYTQAGIVYALLAVSARLEKLTQVLEDALNAYKEAQ